MSKKKKPAVGAITWFDLTVKNAPKVRAFYEKVVGWKSSGLDLGGYDDFCRNTPADGKAVAGICHARVKNAALPPQWLLYITVANLDAMVKRCRNLGGKVIFCPRAIGGGRVAVICDPAGSACALYEA